MSGGTNTTMKGEMPTFAATLVANFPGGVEEFGYLVLRIHPLPPAFWWQYRLCVRQSALGMDHCVSSLKWRSSRSRRSDRIPPPRGLVPDISHKNSGLRVQSTPSKQRHGTNGGGDILLSLLMDPQQVQIPGIKGSDDQWEEHLPLSLHNLLGLHILCIQPPRLSLNCLDLHVPGNPAGTRKDKEDKEEDKEKDKEEIESAAFDRFLTCSAVGFHCLFLEISLF